VGVLCDTASFALNWKIVVQSKSVEIKIKPRSTAWLAARVVCVVVVGVVWCDLSLMLLSLRFRQNSSVYYTW
jgi:hypothetical protein